MYFANHTTSRSLLRPSSTREPSDPPSEVIEFSFVRSFLVREPVGRQLVRTWLRLLHEEIDDLGKANPLQPVGRQAARSFGGLFR